MGRGRGHGAVQKGQAGRNGPSRGRDVMGRRNPGEKERQNTERVTVVLRIARAQSEYSVIKRRRHRIYLEKEGL
jgi:hypothetical protein